MQCNIPIAHCSWWWLTLEVETPGKVLYIYVCIYIYYHENNVPFRLLPQCLCGNSCTWAHDVQLPKCMSCHKATVVITGRAHCFRDCIFIYIDLYIVMYLFHAFILQSVASFQKAFDEYKFRREIYQKNY